MQGRVVVGTRRRAAWGSAKPAGRQAAKQCDAGGSLQETPDRTSVNRKSTNHKTGNRRLKNVVFNGTSDHHRLLDNLAASSGETGVM